MSVKLVYYMASWWRALHVSRKDAMARTPVSRGPSGSQKLPASARRAIGNKAKKNSNLSPASSAKKMNKATARVAMSRNSSAAVNTTVRTYKRRTANWAELDRAVIEVPHTAKSVDDISDAINLAIAGAIKISWTNPTENSATKLARYKNYLPRPPPLAVALHGTTAVPNRHTGNSPAPYI